MSELFLTKLSFQSINLATIAAEEELSNDKTKTLKKTYEDLMDQLEIDGYKKNQISIIGQKIIVEKKQNILKSKGWNSDEIKKVSIGSWWFEIAKKKQCVDPYYSRNIKVDPQPDQEIVPYKNPYMKVLCYDLINLCRILIEKSKEGIRFEDTFGEKQMSEFYKQMGTVINNCKNAVDNKTKVSKNVEVFFLECLSTVIGNVHKCTRIFMEQNLIRLKEQGKFFTTKQALKFQKGGKQSQQLILKPTSRDQAIFLDYNGVQCECGSFRIRQKDNSYKLECYDCDKIITSGHVSKCSSCKIPLYKERLLYIVKTGKCENCNVDIDLPGEMIEYAKS